MSSTTHIDLAALLDKQDNSSPIKLPGLGCSADPTGHCVLRFKSTISGTATVTHNRWINEKHQHSETQTFSVGLDVEKFKLGVNHGESLTELDSLQAESIHSVNLQGTTVSTTYICYQCDKKIGQGEVDQLLGAFVDVASGNAQAVQPQDLPAGVTFVNHNTITGNTSSFSNAHSIMNTTL